MMVIVMGEFRLPLDRRADALPAMHRVITATRNEDGCIAYSYAEDVADPGLFRVSEAWESRAHLAAHLQMPHMQVWKEERETFGLSGRQISLYEVSGTEAI